jgi:hypothetical protein
MAELCSPTPSDRAETRATAARILEAVQADQSIAFAANISRNRAGEYPASALVYGYIDAEARLTQLSQEVAALAGERDEWRDMLDTVCEWCQDKCGHRTEQP